MAARATDMMGPRELTAFGALIGVRCHKRVVGPTVVAAGFGNFVLLDGHAATSVRYRPAVGHHFNQADAAHTAVRIAQSTPKSGESAKIQIIACWARGFSGLFPVFFKLFLEIRQDRKRIIAN